MTLPDWLVSELSHHQLPEQSGEEMWPQPAAGDLRFAAHMDHRGGQPRLVLVFGVDDGARAAHVALVTPDVEVATDSDALLDSHHTGLPYAVTVETDVIGSLWFAQLGAKVGAVAADSLVPIAAAIRGDSRVDFHRGGLPLRGLIDGRWTWKEREIRNLAELCSDCVRRMVEGPSLSQAIKDLFPVCANPVACRVALQGALASVRESTPTFPLSDLRVLDAWLNNSSRSVQRSMTPLVYRNLARAGRKDAA